MTQPATARTTVDRSVLDLALELLDRYDAALDAPVVYWRDAGHQWKVSAGELRRSYREFRSVV